MAKNYVTVNAPPPTTPTHALRALNICREMGTHVTVSKSRQGVSIFFSSWEQNFKIQISDIFLTLLGIFPVRIRHILEAKIKRYTFFYRQPDLSSEPEVANEILVNEP